MGDDSDPAPRPQDEKVSIPLRFEDALRGLLAVERDGDDPKDNGDDPRRRPAAQKRSTD